MNKGIWNGRPMICLYNRQEKREYIKKYKNNKNAEYCSCCKAKTLTITDDNCKNCCELCGTIKEELMKGEK